MQGGGQRQRRDDDYHTKQVHHHSASQQHLQVKSNIKVGAFLVLYSTWLKQKQGKQATGQQENNLRPNELKLASCPLIASITSALNVAANHPQLSASWPTTSACHLSIISANPASETLISHVFMQGSCHPTFI